MLEYYKAFRTLSTRRPHSAMGGLNPIPFTDILAYLTLFGTDDEEFFVSVVCSVDAAFVRHFLNKAESSQKAKS